MVTVLNIIFGINMLAIAVIAVLYVIFVCKEAHARHLTRSQNYDIIDVEKRKEHKI